ncbi:MAG: hypothetical protein AB2768_11060 [Candidatus Thiodiazotropha endolucinida]
MTNSANGIQSEIKVKGQKLGTVTSFNYLGAVVSDDGSKPDVLSSIAQATAALTKLKPIWRDNNISLGSKVIVVVALLFYGLWRLSLATFFFLKSISSGDATVSFSVLVPFQRGSCFKGGSWIPLV